VCPERSRPRPSGRVRDTVLIKDTSGNELVKLQKRLLRARDTMAIAVAGLRKSFGGKVVLDGIELQVAEGTIFALLGPNGAGKTTMVQILSTLIGADGGEASVAGHDLAQEPDAVRAAFNRDPAPAS
jgi:ABC-type polysaccharide/polyol phosphate transport system ATPase subunit